MPFPSETWVSSFTSTLQMVGDELRAYYAQMTGWLHQEHKEDGTHSAIHADSLTVDGAVTATGNGTFAGDVIALFGSGHEVGIGALATVNGASLLPADATRYGLLMGGVTGTFLEQRASQTPFTSGNEIALWNLGFSTSKPILRWGSISGTMTMIDGGSGSTIAIGDSTEPIASVTTSLLVLAGAQAGRWTTPTYADSDYKGDGVDANWVVGAGDVGSGGYTILDKTMTVTVFVLTSDVAGTPTNLQFTIPGGNTAARNTQTIGYGANAGGGREPVILFVAAAGTIINLQRLTGGAWTNTTGNTSVLGEITFEIA